MDWKELVLVIVVTIKLLPVLMMILSKRIDSFESQTTSLVSATRHLTMFQHVLCWGTITPSPFPYISLLLHIVFRPWKQKAMLMRDGGARRMSMSIQNVVRLSEMVCATLRNDHQLEKHLSYSRSNQNWSQPYHTLCIMKAFGARPVFWFWERGIATQILNAKVKAKSKQPWF